MCKFVGPQKLMWHNIMKSTKIKKTLILHIVLVGFTYSTSCKPV